MIDRELQLKIQAFLDGELAETEAREIAALIAKDREAAALHTELKNTRQALSGAEQGIALPESRDFYWSKIRREIERTEQQPERVPVRLSPFQWLNRWLKPVFAVAMVLVLGVLVFQQVEHGARPDVLVASTEMDAITFRDDTDGTTYVWFTDASENDIANNRNANTLN